MASHPSRARSAEIAHSLFGGPRKKTTKRFLKNESVGWNGFAVKVVKYGKDQTIIRGTGVSERAVPTSSIEDIPNWEWHNRWDKQWNGKKANPRKNPEWTPEQYRAAQKFLQAEAGKEYAAQVRAHVKAGRSRTTARYAVPEWHQEMVNALGLDDPSTFLALKHEYLGRRSLRPLKKNPKTAWYIIRVAAPRTGIQLGPFATSAAAKKAADSLVPAGRWSNERYAGRVRSTDGGWVVTDGSDARVNTPQSRHNPAAKKRNPAAKGALLKHSAWDSTYRFAKPSVYTERAAYTIVSYPKGDSVYYSARYYPKDLRGSMEQVGTAATEAGALKLINKHAKGVVGARHNPADKPWALAKRSGWDDNVVSMHETREAAEAALAKKTRYRPGSGDTPQSVGYMIVKTGKGTPGKGYYDVITIDRQKMLRLRT